MTGAAQMLTVRVPLAVRKPRGGRKLMIAPASTTNRGSSAADTTLVKALARAFRWRRMMEAGRYGTIDELAAAEKINSSYVSRLLRDAAGTGYRGGHPGRAAAGGDDATGIDGAVSGRVGQSLLNTTDALALR